MCQVNNERERNILGEEEDQIGGEPIWWRRRRKEKEKKKRESQFVGTRKGNKKKRKEGKKKAFDFRCSDGKKVDRPRIKVDSHDESYAWVLKMRVSSPSKR